jgi:hypothetical protein
MKIKKFYFITTLLISSLGLQAQSPPETHFQSFDYRVDEGYQCVTEEQRLLIIDKINNNIQMLKDEGRLLYDEASKPELAAFGWPVKMAEGVGYNQIWGISNFVDHQAGSGLLDYYCGAKTYNGHKGTDIYLWPFYWYAMDYLQAENVAAADGQIILKSDGNDDRSCVMGGGEWNAIYLQHTDGSIGWYGHMKKGSLTTKNVGDTVSKGEFLGVVGSSGNSTGPHLHFEVYDGSSLIDPFQGSCNSLNTESWWEDQLEHDNPSINALLTHFAPPVFPECPQQEIPNIKDYFETGELVYIAVYLTDQMLNSTMNLKVIRPDGSTHNQWDVTSSETYYLSLWYWPLETTMDGNWKWQVTYNGKTVTHDFYVGQLNTDENEIKEFKVFPNPTTDLVQIESAEKVTEIQLINSQGKVIRQISDMNGIKSISLRTLPSGVYIIKATDIHRKNSVTKIIKK